MAEKNKNNILIYNEVYPEAKNIFKSPKVKIKEVIKNCLVVLDTNILLIPYSVSSNNVTEIRKVFELLVGENRLFIPAQVAREFANNRPKKISSIFQQLNRKRNSIEQFKIGKYPILENNSEYDNIKNIEEEINKSIKKYKKSIGVLISSVENWIWDDPISIIYSEIFTPDIIIEPEIDKDTIESELDNLITHKLPPGYKDSSKQDKGITEFERLQGAIDLNEYSFSEGK